MITFDFPHLSKKSAECCADVPQMLYDLIKTSMISAQYQALEGGELLRITVNALENAVKKTLNAYLLAKCGCRIELCSHAAPAFGIYALATGSVESAECMARLGMSEQTLMARELAILWNRQRERDEYRCEKGRYFVAHLVSSGESACLGYSVEYISEMGIESCIEAVLAGVPASDVMA